jgi:hypothetical protein
MKLRNGVLKARWIKLADPPALGYLVTSST